MSSQHRSLLTQWQTEQLELAQKHEEESLRLAEEARTNQLRLARDQKFELQKQHQNKWIQAESLFQKLAKEEEKGRPPMDAVIGDDPKEDDPEEEPEEDDPEEDDQEEDDLEVSQNTINTFTVMVRKSNNELSEARKIAAKMVQAVDTVEARRLIGEARKRKRLGKLEPPVIGFKLVGSIDEAPWAAEFKRRFKSADNWDFKMMEELSTWENIVRDPFFWPFKNVEIGDGKWKKEIDQQNEQLSSLKKNHGIRVYNSVTTALMEMDEYNSSGRYPVPTAWNVKESRIATLKEVFSHLAPAIEAFVGPVSHDIHHAAKEQQAPNKKRRSGRKDKRVLIASETDSE